MFVVGIGIGVFWIGWCSCCIVCDGWLVVLVVGDVVLMKRCGGLLGGLYNILWNVFCGVVGI